MSRSRRVLAQLCRIAQGKADAELTRYAALRVQADSLQGEVEQARAALAGALSAPAGAGLDQWRMATALVGYQAAELHRAEAALARMRPALDTAHQHAATAFGRAEALRRLRQITLAREKLAAERRSG